MSRKNKIENKSARRSARTTIIVVDWTPVSRIPQKVSARLLSDPKAKLTGSTRRRLQKSRGCVLVQPPCITVSLAGEVKVALRLESLTMTKLIRRLKQAARRASTCKHLLAALHEGSKFAAPIAAEQTHQLSICRQVAAEISVRNHNTQH